MTFDLHQAGALRAWIGAHDLGGLDVPAEAGAAAHDLVELGLLALPQPGSGRTRDRFRSLAVLGAGDCVLARLGEGHADAVAILRELSGPAPSPGDLWSVWAAQPPGSPGLLAEEEAGQWRLRGDKPYCSGAGTCDWALVTAMAAGESRLLAVRVRQPGVEPVPGTWPAVGMAGSDSRTVRFTDAYAVPVGGPGDYTARPGFWQGAVGVAACWLGGAIGVAHALTSGSTGNRLTAHGMAHLGYVDSEIAAMTALLDSAAAQVDLDPSNHQGRAALVARRTRAVVERGCQDIIDRVGRALGAGPLSLDHAHSRRVADLTVYLRQSHAERDLEALGAQILELGEHAKWLEGRPLGS